jgi:hypothetical protein
MRSRARPLLLALFMLSPLATRAATQQLARSHAPAVTPLAVQWSVPTSQVTRHIPSWSATDVGLATGFLALLWVDAAQTRSLARQGWTDFHESNPILGQEPSVRRINTYTAAAAVATLGIAAVLPPRARRWWLAGAVAVEASTVIHNTTSVGVAFTIR